MKAKTGAFFSGGTFFSLSAFFIALLASGKTSALVHPRMNPCIAVGAAISLAMGIAAIFAAPRMKTRVPAPARAIPLLALMAATGIYAWNGNPSPIAASAEQRAFLSAIEAREGAWKKSNAAKLPRLLDFNDDAVYWPLYNRVYDDPGQAAGRRIRVQGFAYREGSYPSGTFLVARNLMWCCSADMALIGFLVRFDGSESLARDGWVEVEGKIELGDARAAGASGERSPIIVDASVRPTERGKSSVIFPY